MTEVRVSQQALLPAPRKRRWTGLSERQERVFRWTALTLIVVMMSGWTVSIVEVYARTIHGPEPGTTVAPPVSRSLSSSILDSRSTTTAYIQDAALEFLDPLRGESGKLRAAFRVPGAQLTDSPDTEIELLYGEEGEPPAVSTDYAAPREPGIYKLAVALDKARRPIEDLRIVTLVPFSEKRQGRIGLYYLGSWPYERGGKPRSSAYANPAGFIEVTAENKDLYVSEHFRLRDFLTKDQPNVWPKYLLLDPKLLDKLELVILELEREGVKVEHVAVMSGFRTPRYNHSGGNTAGRANLSRHIYGDAADIFVDNDRDGWTDDITGDGRVNVQDAEKIAAAVERVHRKYPSMAGGIGVYPACCGHGPFTHIDVRGYNALWRGSGNG
jgi:uncharacterized protein YcbK (DUF882 family)